MIRWRYKINGIVQGVGFRPFIYKLATKYNLSGYVLNNSQGLEIEIQGLEENLNLFHTHLTDSPPPLSNITNIQKDEIKFLHDSNQFLIIQSNNEKSKNTLISPDISICNECKDDLKNHSHYNQYFAINCTNCGPRYSIIQTVPYDRLYTSMNVFEMCEECKANYQNPLNRRYHAQPIACQKCGPQLALIDVENKTLKDISHPIKKMANLIQEGHIVAIKGIGGFHLVCNSANNTAIQNLRKHKNRQKKPFALMCKDIEQIKSFADVNSKEEELLISKEAPIVILDTKKQNNLSPYIAPHINKIGCMLPYTALHMMLFEYLNNPIIATSANLGDEPIITTNKDIQEKLPFVKYILDFNRNIINAVDDSLVQVIDNKIQILRLARGYAPKVIHLSHNLDTRLLSVGANQKSTISIGFNDKIILSPHIGDISNKKSFDYFLSTIETFKTFYDFKPNKIITDIHPNYESTKWVETTNIKSEKTQHHLSHIYSVMAEHNLKGEYLGFSFDGTGLGNDGSLWGGEVFLGECRKYYFKPIKLLGGEKAIKEPRRIALSMLFDKYTLEDIRSMNLDCIKSFTLQELSILNQAYIKDINSPSSSSVGRLFDAIASLSGVLQFQTYEGEAGLLCETYYNKYLQESFTYKIDNNGEITINFDFFDKNIITKFINTLINIILEISMIEKKEIIFSGGVFQNKTLTSELIKKLQLYNITYYYNQTTPCNDGGISLGQIYKTILKDF